VKPAARIRTTDAQIDAAIKRAKAQKPATRIAAARFDQLSDAVVVKPLT
jgi:hypothetical protein